MRPSSYGHREYLIWQFASLVSSNIDIEIHSRVKAPELFVGAIYKGLREEIWWKRPLLGRQRNDPNCVGNLYSSSLATDMRPSQREFSGTNRRF